MSLTDALLLDEYRSPKEVWIAARGESGPFGSGTQADPYNGSVISSTALPAKTVTSLTKTGTPATTATATASNHDFATGEWISIAGIDQTQNLNRYYAGTFQITVVDANSFTYTMVGEPASSSASGTITCWKERERFDILLHDIIPPNARIFLGPGEFQTKGFTFEIVGSTKMKSGWHIIGSGIEVTKLKIVNAPMAESHYSALGIQYGFEFLDGFTAEEFTVDCNVGGQLHENVACGVTVLAGRNICVRRVRAINFRTQTVNYVENFVFFFAVSGLYQNDAAYEPTNLVWEECIARWNKWHILAGQNRNEGHWVRN